jgi:uncharacterized membrane protein
LSEEIRIKKIVSTFFDPESYADLMLIDVWLLASILAVYLPILNESRLRILLTLPLVLFIPGYCLIATLFPKKSDIDLMERIALSFGLSIAIVSLIGLGLNFTPWGIRLDPILISLTIFTGVMIVIVYYRRAILPVEERFRIPFTEIVGTIRKGIFHSEGSKIDRLQSTILVLVIITAVITTIFVITFPKEGEHFSEYYILGEKGRAADYPDLIIAGQHYPMFIGVGNHENRSTNYTIEIWAIQSEFDSITNDTNIKTIELLDRQSLVLSNNETKVIPYNLSVNKTEYNRVAFLLFNETIPGPDVKGSDRIITSYRDLTLWITVR